MSKPLCNCPVANLSDAPGSGELLAWMIIFWAGATLSLTSLQLWLGHPVNAYPLWLGLTVALASTWKLVPNLRIWFPAMLGLALASSMGTLVLEWLIDFSGDGQEYHLPAILALVQGWNPFHAARLTEWNPGFESHITSAIYVQHYAKGAWLLAAATSSGSGMLEGSKLWNFLYPLAVLLVAAALLRRIGLTRVWSWGLALAVAANPVSFYQLPSFYVDGQLAALYTLVLLFSLDYLIRPMGRKLILAALSIMLLANIKFTGLVYAIGLVWGLVAWAWWWGIRGGLRAYLRMACVVPLAAVTLIGYQPYVTNTLQKGHPFYPAIGREDGRNVQWNSAPPQYLSMNRVEKLVYSLGSRSSGSSIMPEWKIPFSVSKQELYVFFSTDARYGGFGPLFGGVLLLALMSLMLTLRCHTSRIIASLGLLVALTSLMNPEAWWARLSPQLWLVPPLLLLCMHQHRTPGLRTGAFLIVVTLIGNALLAGGVNWGRAIEKNLAFRSQLARMYPTPNQPLLVNSPFRFRMATETHLRKLGIHYRLTDQLSCPRPLSLSYPVATYACPPDGR